VSTMRMSPYINFQGRAREALEFYQRVIGGQLALITMDNQGQSRPAAPGDRISHGQLETEDGALIVGSDGHPDYPPTVGDNIAIALSGTDPEKVAAIFTNLAESGNAKMPLTEHPGGDSVGWLIDGFGVNWMITRKQA
jgi:PhnB protein